MRRANWRLRMVVLATPCIFALFTACGGGGDDGASQQAALQKLMAEADAKAKTLAEKAASDAQTYAAGVQQAMALLKQCGDKVTQLIASAAANNSRSSASDRNSGLTAILGAALGGNTQNATAALAGNPQAASLVQGAQNQCSEKQREAFLLIKSLPTPNPDDDPEKRAINDAYWRVHLLAQVKDYLTSQAQALKLSPQAQQQIGMQLATMLASGQLGGAGGGDLSSLASIAGGALSGGALNTNNLNTALASVFGGSTSATSGGTPLSGVTNGSWGNTFSGVSGGEGGTLPTNGNGFNLNFTRPKTSGTTKSVTYSENGNTTPSTSGRGVPTIRRSDTGEGQLTITAANQDQFVAPDEIRRAAKFGLPSSSGRTPGN